jgi:hypothetical protein
VVTEAVGEKDEMRLVPLGEGGLPVAAAVAGGGVDQIPLWF